MTIRYFVKKTLTKSPSNHCDCSHDTQEYVIGIRDRAIYAKGTLWNDFDYLKSPYFLDEYGYKSIESAKRSYAYTHPQNDEHWQTKVEIIEVELMSGAIATRTIEVK